MQQRSQLWGMGGEVKTVGSSSNRMGRDPDSTNRAQPFSKTSSFTVHKRWQTSRVYCNASRQNLRHHVAPDVRQSVVAPLETVGELGVPDSQQMQDGRLEVVGVDRITHHVVAKVVRRSQGNARTNPRASHPQGKRLHVVVPAIVAIARISLIHGRSAKLATPNDQRILQQSPLLEVPDQGRRRLIHGFGGKPEVVCAIGMLAGFCGTLMTPMAANFNVVPANLLELPDRKAALNGVIRAQIPTALPLLVANILLMYFLAFPT